MRPFVRFLFIVYSVVVAIAALAGLIDYPSAYSCPGGMWCGMLAFLTVGVAGYPWSSMLTRLQLSDSAEYWLMWGGVILNFLILRGLFALTKGPGGWSNQSAGPISK